jgi:hypothetical protein
MRKAYKIFAENPEWKRDLGRPRHRLPSNIKMDIKETRDGMDSFRSGQGPVVGSCEHSNEPLGSTNDRDLLDQLSDNQPLSSQTIIS